MKTETSVRKHRRRENYPIPGYNGHTTDEEHCPRCGSENVTRLGNFSSGRRIGICHECGENYVLDPD